MNSFATMFPQSSHPIANTSSSSNNSSSDSSQKTPSNQLDPNDFITLLTTQLQAQDPLNPLDPTQMVNELTAMNTFQQLLQIRQDMDTLVGAATSAGNSSAANASIAQAALAKSLSSQLTQNLLSSQKSQSLHF